jgi:hypothetical protein
MIKYEVVRYTPKDRYESWQILYKCWYTHGVRVWRTEIDREYLPNWACIDLACFGSSEWKSRLLPKLKRLQAA